LVGLAAVLPFAVNAPGPLGIATGAAGSSPTRRLGSWRSLLIAGLAMAATQTALGLSSSVIITAVMMFGSSGAFALFNITAVTMQNLGDRHANSLRPVG
jgi:hypothetical protein